MNENLPQQKLVPVVPNRLQVGKEYVYVTLSGLRPQVGFHHPFSNPRPKSDLVPQRVKIEHISDVESTGYDSNTRYYRMILLTNIDTGIPELVRFDYNDINELERYSNNDAIFFETVFDRREPLLGSYQRPRNASSGGSSASGGRRRRATRSRKNRTRK